MFFPSVVVRAFPGTSFERDERKSILATIAMLWGHGQCVTTALLLLFSIVLPIGKLAMQGHILLHLGLWPKRAGHLRPIVEFLARSSPFQMLDVFVGALFVAFLKAHLTTAEMASGGGLFLCYCLASTGLSQGLQHAWSHDFSQSDSQPTPLLAGPVMDSVRSIDDALSQALPSLLLEGGGRAAGAREPLLLEGGQAAQSFAAVDSPGQRHTKAVTPLLAAGSCAYLFLGPLVVLSGDMLQVRVMFEGLIVDSSKASLLSVMAAQCSPQPSALGMTVAAVLFCFVVAFPWLHCFLNLIVFFSNGAPAVGRAAEFFLHWATPDVFAMAAMMFLVIAQDEHTLTSVPQEPGETMPAFFIVVLVGFLFAAIRFSLTKYSLAFAFLGFACAYEGLISGSPTRVAEIASMMTAGETCRESMRVANALLERAPASVGLCGEAAQEGARPPCLASGGPLARLSVPGVPVTLSVPWMDGLNTLALDRCAADFGHMRACSRSTEHTCRFLPCRPGLVCVDTQCRCPPRTCAGPAGGCFPKPEGAAATELGVTPAETCGRDTGQRCLLFCAPWRQADCKNGSCICKLGTCVGEDGMCGKPPAPVSDAEGGNTDPGQVITLWGTFTSLRAYVELQQCTGEGFQDVVSKVSHLLPHFLGGSAGTDHGAGTHLNSTPSCSKVFGSSDECCGANLRVRIQVKIPCVEDPREPLPASQVQMDVLDPIWFQAPVLGRYNLQPVVQQALHSKTGKTLDQVRISWGARTISLQEFISQLVANNAEPHALRCPAPR